MSAHIQKNHKPSEIATSITSKQVSIAQETSLVTVFDRLPNDAYIRESQLVQSPKRPSVPAPLPFSAPTLWRKVKDGTFPKPVKLSNRVTAWRVGDIRNWLEAITLESQNV